MSSGRYELGWVLELAVELAGDVALEASFDLAVGLALGSAAFGVGAGVGIVAQPGQRDGVQGAVELAVAGPVEAVAGRLARAGGDRCDAGEHGEGSIVADPARVGP